MQRSKNYKFASLLGGVVLVIIDMKFQELNSCFNEVNTCLCPHDLFFVLYEKLVYFA